MHRYLDCMHVCLCTTTCMATPHRGQKSLNVPRTGVKRAVSQHVDVRNQHSALNH